MVAGGDLIYELVVTQITGIEHSLRNIDGYEIVILLKKFCLSFTNSSYLFGSIH